MASLRNLIIAGVLALAGAAPVSVAEAQPSMQPLQAQRQSDVTQARVVCDRWGCERVRRHHHRPRVVIRPGYYPDDYYYRPYRPRYRPYRPRTVYIEPPVIVRPAPRVVVRSGYNAHVRWCLNRYQSYNPDTNRFLAYDGYYKICRSPYR